MSNIKPSLAKGTRDFSPQEMVKRNYIFDTIKKVFKKYGYAEIQTPAMENLSTLTGKYGDEGDKLIFKILESGEYTKSVIDELNRRLSDIVIASTSKKTFLKIAADFELQIIDAIFNKGNDKGSIQREYLENILHSKSFDELKITDSLPNIKSIFLDYFFGRGNHKQFKKYDTRIQFYCSLLPDRDKIKSKVSRGLLHVVNNDKNLFKLISSEIVARNLEIILKLLLPKELTESISKKALRYDLTVPFARYVVMHQNDISLPFKRFQIQPVWRADRPQRGRYREFYQCDVDVVGSESLLNEAEFVLIYQEALSNLGMTDFTIKINNRKILSGIAEIIGKPELIVGMTVAIDKLDKIGFDGVTKELLERGFTEGDINALKPVILLQGSNDEKLKSLKKVLSSSDIGLKGIEEIETVFAYVRGLLSESNLKHPDLELDITLARGLNYYTGCIFEVKTNEVIMGSICGGGRYDDLTGGFGLKGLTGVGISFGADRIYDVLQELNLFPESTAAGTKVLIINFDREGELYALPLLQQLREAGISSELYPSSAKLKKQMSYADDKAIPYVILIGHDELQSGQLTIKDMKLGIQQKLTTKEIIQMLKEKI